jgi:hypothetical protein
LTRQSNAVKKIVIDKLLKHFSLSEEDIKIINEAEVSPEFFNVLAKIGRITENSKLLFAFESQNIGNELLESLSECEQKAYQRLARWLVGEAWVFQREAPELSRNFKLGMNHLKKRPILLQ